MVATTPPTPPTPPAQAGDTYDPYAAAMGATWDPTFRVFGQAQIEVYPCILEKGVGKVRFDPARHPVDRRCTAVEIVVLPVQPGRQPVERQMIAESREWAAIVKPSLLALSTDLGRIHNQWVEAQLVPSGRKYTDATTNEQKDATTIKFARIFGSEEECLAASQQPSRNGAGSATSPAASPSHAAAGGVVPAPPAAGGNGAPNEREKAIAAKFLPALIQKAAGDPEHLERLLKGNPLTSKYFDLTSPEVAAAFNPTAQVPF
jgi:hypothetical protein